MARGCDWGQTPAGLTPEFRYIYDSMERLTRIENGSGGTIAEYGYNPFGHRMWKEVSGSRTYFLYNYSGLVGEYDASGNTLKEYHYWPDATWMTQPMFQRDNGQVYYYQNDHLGTPQRMVATSGAVVWEAEYTAFGKASVFKETISNNLRFPGQYFDAGTGLHHNYFRDYDPELGRYVQSDPIGLGGGNNVYVYVEDNPVKFIDMFGLEKLVLFDPSDKTVYDASQTVPDQEGVLNIWGHASPEDIKDDRDGKDNRKVLTPSELAELIRNSGKWSSGMPVVIWGCNAGKGDDSFAERLSDELDTWVKAPNGFLIVIGEDYRVRKGPTLYSEPREFKNFSDGSNFDGSTDGACECSSF